MGLYGDSATNTVDKVEQCLIDGFACLNCSPSRSRSTESFTVNGNRLSNNPSKNQRVPLIPASFRHLRFEYLPYEHACRCDSLATYIIQPQNPIAQVSEPAKKA